MDTADSPSSALVIWGSTGPRLQLTRQDLRMPESIKERQNYQFFLKQWDAVAGFWMNRVLKEAALQHATASDIVQCIVKDIERRWEQRRREKTLHKRRKRLLDPQGAPVYGVPSPHILLTNFVSLVTYRKLVADGGSLKELIQALLSKVEQLAKEKVLEHQVLVDESGVDEISDGGGCASGAVTKKFKAEEGTTSAEGREEGTVATPAFDDHVALVCTLSSKFSAASAVAGLHGSTFDSRAIMCRFYDL
uniref:Uncharacterized protein TCIL3000_7_5050 n=1 Tax=Trypanosoma congolense (strain IL3000) TaxID=1068625 RepID=G0UQN0_TRYCI|nr:unnamed protein product [Trypanosoma congolense IL3000]